MYFLFASLGLMFILRYGTILQGIRNLLIRNFPCLTELFNCSLCLGFWTGLVLSPLSPDDYTTVDAVLFPLVSAAFCYIVDMLFDVVVVSKNYSSSDSGLSKSITKE